MDAFLPQSSSALLSRKSKQSCKHSPYLGIFIFCYTSQLLLVCFILFIRLFSCFTGPSILSRTTETENAIKDGSTNSFRGRRKSPHSRTRSLNLNEVSSLGAIHFTDLGTLSYQQKVNQKFQTFLGSHLGCVCICLQDILGPCLQEASGEVLRMSGALLWLWIFPWCCWLG